MVKPNRQFSQPIAAAIIIIVALLPCYLEAANPSEPYHGPDSTSTYSEELNFASSGALAEKSEEKSRLQILFSSLMSGIDHFLKQSIGWSIAESQDDNVFWKGELVNWKGDRVNMEIFKKYYYFGDNYNFSFGVNSYEIKSLEEQSSFLNGFALILGPASLEGRTVGLTFPGIQTAPLLNTERIDQYFIGNPAISELLGFWNIFFSPLAFLLAAFSFQAFLFWRLAARFGRKDAYLAWVPVLNDFLVIKMAEKSRFWWPAIYIPFLGLGVSLFLWREIFHKLNLSGFFAVLMLIPFINILTLISLLSALRPPESASR